MIQRSRYTSRYTTKHKERYDIVLENSVYICYIVSCTGGLIHSLGWGEFTIMVCIYKYLLQKILYKKFFLLFILLYLFLINIKYSEMINWINSWKSGKKKEKYEICFRLGTWTILEIMFCPCFKCENKKASCAKFRFMILNFGFEI